MKPRSTHITSSCMTTSQKHKHGSEDNISEINNELKHIADKLSMGNRIECMKKREAFISLKDHKENFENNPENITHKKYSNETELSKHIWHLKQNKTDFTIKWSIIKKSISYTGGSKRCNLCLEEKLNTLKEKDNCLLNKRSEIISACQHKNRFQVKSLNKERNACYFNDNTPTFPP